MPEAERIMFELREIAEILVREQGIKSGLWGVAVEFGLAAANVPIGPDSFSPASINLVQKLGIQKFEKASNLTVDAAMVNPQPKKMNRASKTKAKK